MINTIARKELQATLREPRFAAGMLVTIILFVVAAFLLGEDYATRLDSQGDIERAQESFASEFAHPNRILWILRPTTPPVWSESLFRGIDDESTYTSFFINHVGILLPPLDLIGLIGLLISLLAVIFSYDSICGEREDGTLKLLHTTRASRAGVFVGKALGLWAAVAVPLLFAYLLAIVVGTVITGTIPGIAEWLSLAMIASGALLYAGFFVCLGLLVSSLVRRSGTSILLLLFLWVLFAMAIPNVSPVISAQMKPLPSVHVLEREHSRIRNRERDDRIHAFAAELVTEYRRTYGIPESVKSLEKPTEYNGLGWTQERIAEVTSGFANRFREIVDKVNEEQKAITDAMWDELDRDVDVQSGIARTISLLSPTASFTYFATGMASLDEHAEEFIEETIGEHQQAMSTFVEQRWRQKEEEVGRPVDVNEFVDISGRPRYTMQLPSLTERVTGALPYAAHMAIYAALALLLGVVAYNRYDIR